MAWKAGSTKELSVVRVVETAIDNSTWTAITLPAAVDCISALCKCRLSTNVWFIASESDAANGYMTIEAGGSYTVDLKKYAAQTLFWIKGTAASDTFEVLLGRDLG